MKKFLILMLTAVMLLQLPVFAAGDSSDVPEDEPLEVTDLTDTTPSEVTSNEEPSIEPTPETTPVTTPSLPPEKTPETTPPTSESTTEKEPEITPDGIQFNINGSTLVECTGTSEKAIIPDEVTYISAGAFDKVQNLKAIVIYNFNCKVAPGAFPKNVTIVSYKNSSAYDEAKRAGNNFTELTPKEITLTIYYQINGAPFAQTYKETLKTGEQYIVPSPSKPGYVADIKEVSGYASRDNITVTVTYYVSSNDGWTIDGSYIKYTENGSFLKNTSKTIDGNTYKFNASGQLELNDEFITIKDKKYYLVNNKITTGYKIIGSDVYYFTENGVMLADSRRDSFLFGEDGTLYGKDGIITIGSNAYYLKDNSLFSGFIELNRNIFYFGEDFSMVKSTSYGTFKFNGMGHLIDGITIEGLIFSSVPNAEFTGKEQKPSVTVKFGNITLTEGIHYELIYTNNIEPGNATVEIKGIGAVSGSKKLNFTIIGEEAYTLTVKYVDTSENSIAPDYVSKYEAGKEYVVYCPFVDGYIAETAVTEGIMPKSDVTITVIYTKEIIDKPVDTDKETENTTDTEPVAPKPPVSSYVVEVEGTSSTNVEKQNVITKTYNWGLLFLVFTIATIVCGGAILLIINWDYIKRYVFKRPGSKRN